LEWNPFWPPQLPQLPVHKDPVSQDSILWNISFDKLSLDKANKPMQPPKHQGPIIKQQQPLAQQHKNNKVQQAQRTVDP